MFLKVGDTVLSKAGILGLAGIVLLALIGMTARSNPKKLPDTTIRAEDVLHIELTLNYSAPLKYRITSQGPITQILEGLADLGSTFVPSSDTEYGPDCELLIVPKDDVLRQSLRVPLGVSKTYSLLWVGDERAIPRDRLRHLIELVMARVTDRKEPPTTDADLPGGYSLEEVGEALRVGGLDFAFTVLDAINEGLERKGDLTNEEKRLQLRSRTFKIALLTKSEDFETDMRAYAKDVVEETYAFIESKAADESVSPAFGGIPYSVTVECMLRFRLEWLYSTAGKPDKALVELEKIDQLLTPEVIQMATDGPSETRASVWDDMSLRKHLEWRKNSYIPDRTTQCKTEIARRVN